MPGPLAQRFAIVDMQAVAPQACPCGNTRRAFLDEPQRPASLHLVDIKEDSALHYHKRLTEIYYVLEGEGHIELDGEQHALKPGMAVMIKPRCRHRAVGALRVLVMPVPAFDPEDEWFD